MSYIPNKAMPHAAPHDDDEDDFEDTGFYEWDGADDDRSVLERVSDLARDNPKTAVGAGIALIAGAVAGLAWPFVKSKSADKPKRRHTSGTRKSAGSGKSAAASTAKRKSATAAKKKPSAGLSGRSKTAATKAAASKGGASSASKIQAGTAKPFAGQLNPASHGAAKRSRSGKAKPRSSASSDEPGVIDQTTSS